MSRVWRRSRFSFWCHIVIFLWSCTDVMLCCCLYYCKFCFVCILFLFTYLTQVYMSGRLDTTQSHLAKYWLQLLLVVMANGHLLLHHQDIWPQAPCCVSCGMGSYCNSHSSYSCFGNRISNISGYGGGEKRGKGEAKTSIKDPTYQLWVGTWVSTN